MSLKFPRLPESCVTGLEAQQQHFCYLAVLSAIISQFVFFVCFFWMSRKYGTTRCRMRYRTDMSVLCVPFWPECLHIKFHNKSLCQAILLKYSQFGSEKCKF